MAEQEERPQVESADELYGLAPESFVAARDALAKRLRAEGERTQADEIKALRRPSVPAAAVNRAVRTEPKLAAAVVEAGESLGEAQQEAIEAGDAGGLRDAMRAETSSIEALVEVIADEGELAGGMLDRARDTIRAAARDADLREEFLAGRMARDAEAVGFGGELVQADPPRRSSSGSKPRAATKPKRGAGKASRPKRDKKKTATEVEPSAAERRKAERAISKAEAAVEKNERKATEASEALDELESAAADAAGLVERSRRELAAAEKALERAERDRDRGAERAEKADARLEADRAALEETRAELAAVRGD